MNIHISGRALSAEILQIYEEFKEEFEKFNNKTYNPLDPKNMVRIDFQINNYVFHFIDIYRRYRTISRSNC